MSNDQNQSEPEMQIALPRQFDVILPAGGRISDDFSRQVGTDVKALIRLEGETLLCRTIRAFRDCGRIRKIFVIGPEAALQEARDCAVDEALPEGSSGPENIYRGLQALPPCASEQRCNTVISTTDLPFLSADTIHRFLAACPSEAQAAVAPITREDFEARFPGSVNTYTRLADGEFTLAGLFLVNAAMTLRNRPYVEGMFHARKSPWRMAGVIGASIALKFITRRLTIQDIVKRGTILTDCHGVALAHMPPELAFDIDEPADYEYARSHFRSEA